MGKKLRHPESVDPGVFDYYPQLSRVRDFAETNYSEDMSLARVAGVAGLERRYFSTFFHAKTGICYRDWLSYIRVRKAQRLLEQRDWSITRTAFEVGFGDLRTFERAFKKWLGLTPRRFKRRVRARFCRNSRQPIPLSRSPR